MPVARIYDAARRTDTFFYDTGGIELFAEGTRKLTFTAPILTGKHAGEIATLEWIGRFDLIAKTGFVTEWRELVGGQTHFSFALDDRVPIEEIFDALDAAVVGGFTYHGNRFQNLLEGDRGADRVFGYGGNDTLVGARGNDRLSGGNGDDILRGGSGRDTMIGGRGDDLLDGRHASADRMAGGPGNDTYLTRDDDDDAVIEAASEGHDVIRAYSQNYELPDNVEDLRMVGRFDNTVNARGNALDNRIVGSAGRDFMSGGDGDDIVSGGDGDDMLMGYRGNDTIRGGDGDDSMWDYHGRNAMFGGRGADTFEGGSRKDTFSGGPGADVFTFASPEASGPSAGRRDVISDFAPGTDKLQLSFMDADATRPDDQAFIFIGSAVFTRSAGELRYASGLLSADVDGDGATDFRVELASSPVLAEADLIL